MTAGNGTRDDRGGRRYVRAGRHLFATGLFWLLTAAPLQGQYYCIGDDPSACSSPDAAASGTSDELVAIGVNVLIGGLTAGVRQHFGDGSFRDGFWRGAIGGAGTYAGKRVVVQDFDGAGLLGRGLAAVGASVTRNASEGRPMLDRLVLPLGFVRFHWHPSRREFYPSIDAAAVLSIAGLYASGLGAELDWGRTFDGGIPTLMARDWDHSRGWHGRFVMGAIVIRGDEPPYTGPEHSEFLNRALRHERVHALQYDQMFILWSDPLERRMLASLGFSPSIGRSVDLSLHGVAVLGLGRILPDNLQPWEDEADFLARTNLKGDW